MRIFYQVLLIFCFLTFHSALRAQCGNRIELTKSAASGSLSFTVESNSSYKGELIAYKNTNKIVVKQFGGTRKMQFSFDTLDPTYAYRISVTFSGTDDFLCGSKVIDGIILGNTSSGQK